MKISGQTIVVTGGSRGLGAGIVEVLAQRGARVCVVARSASHQPFATAQGKVVSITGDIRDKILARQIIKDYQPTAIILNAGAIPPTTPIDVIDWDVFSQPWETDVRGALVWMQASLAAPLQAPTFATTVNPTAEISPAISDPIEKRSPVGSNWILIVCPAVTVVDA